MTSLSLTMVEIFEYTRDELVLLGELLGISYKSVNMLVYFGIFPFFYWWPIDKLIGKHVTKITQLIALILVIAIKPNETLENSFDYIASGLASMQWLGLNYLEASVVFCVFVPLLIWMILFYFAYRKKIKEIWNVMKP